MPKQPFEVLQGQVIQTFLEASRLSAFSNGQNFFTDGKMSASFIWLWENRGKLSRGEQIVFDVAREIWNWEPQVKIFELVNMLSPELVELIFSLYMAWMHGESAIVAWIEEHKQ